MCFTLFCIYSSSFLHLNIEKKWKKNCSQLQEDYNEKSDARFNEFMRQTKLWHAGAGERQQRMEDIKKRLVDIQEQEKLCGAIISIAGHLAGISKTYLTWDAMGHFNSYFKDNRVDTVREAINLYERELQMRELNAKLDAVNNEMNERANQTADYYRQLINAQENIAIAQRESAAELNQRLAKLQASATLIETYQIADYVEHKNA